jgi:conserved domain protein
VPRNTLGDLNNHLFAQLERLNDEEITGEKLEDEIIRSKAVIGVSKQIIANANVVLKAKSIELEYGKNNEKEMPKMLEGGE